MTDIPSQKDVDQFILEEIDSVPHLEALLLLLHDPSKQWQAADMARALYVQPEVAQKVLEDLTKRRLISDSAAGPQPVYRYQPRSEETHRLIEALDATYRRQVVRISTMIHSKASPGVREFARAFRFTKDRE